MFLCESTLFTWLQRISRGLAVIGAVRLGVLLPPELEAHLGLIGTRCRNHAALEQRRALFVELFIPDERVRLAVDDAPAREEHLEL